MKKRTIAGMLLIVMLLNVFLTGCSNSTIEDSTDMSKAIAEFLEVDKVELNSTKVVGKYSYVCFYYNGPTKEESGYSYAAFRKRYTGDYVLEFAQVPSKLIPMAEGIGGAYFDDHMILVSSNDKLDKISLTGDIQEEIKVKNTPYIFAIDIFQGLDIALNVECSFYDIDGEQIL